LLGRQTLWRMSWRPACRSLEGEFPTKIVELGYVLVGVDFGCLVRADDGGGAHGGLVFRSARCDRSGTGGQKSMTDGRMDTHVRGEDGRWRISHLRLTRLLAELA